MDRKMDTNSEINEKLYKRIDVWKRINDEKVARYLCFQILEEGEFCVQSADFFNYPVRKSDLWHAEIQAVDLFLESPPEERNAKYSSLTEAIQAHDDEFANFSEEIGEEERGTG